MRIIEWNGNLGNLPNPMLDYYYRVLDELPTADEMLNCIVSYKNGRTVYRGIFAQPYDNGFYLRPSTDGTEENSSNYVYIVHTPDDTFVKKGLYFYNQNIYNSAAIEDTYVTLFAYTPTPEIPPVIDLKSFCTGLLYELSGHTLKLED